MGHQFVFRISDRSIGLIGLCITVIGLFLPWMIWPTPYYALREQVYAATASYIYPYYYPIYELGITGAGWQTSIATLIAAYALFTETKRRPGLLSVSSLMIFYNVGSILAMFLMYDYYYYYAPYIGPGIFVSLIGGIFFLISALVGISQTRRKKIVSFCRKCGSSLLNSYQFCPYCSEETGTSQD